MTCSLPSCDCGGSHRLLTRGTAAQLLPRPWVQLVELSTTAQTCILKRAQSAAKRWLPVCRWGCGWLWLHEAEAIHPPQPPFRGSREEEKPWQVLSFMVAALLSGMLRAQVQCGRSGQQRQTHAVSAVSACARESVAGELDVPNVSLRRPRVWATGRTVGVRQQDS